MQFYFAHNGVQHTDTTGAAGHQLGTFLLVAAITTAFMLTLLSVLTSLGKKEESKDTKK